MSVEQITAVVKAMNGASGNTLNKGTAVSVGLVIVIVGAVFWIVSSQSNLKGSIDQAVIEVKNVGEAVSTHKEDPQLHYNIRAYTEQNFVTKPQHNNLATDVEEVKEDVKEVKDDVGEILLEVKSATRWRQQQKEITP
tara:strand:+ start:1184 stop:1597 length:414 start_codon:yes stop_codon:yes gene_type:complete